MIENWTDLSEFLVQDHIYSSAPARLHCGGSTDHRLAGLLCRHWRPATANISIDLRAHVRLGPYEPGKVLVEIEGIGTEEFRPPDLPLKGPFALASALVCYFGVSGFHVAIRTDFPFQSGLGGSGAVTIALIGALTSAIDRKPPPARSYPRLAQIAHNLEDSLFGNTGLQDQAAALYGGVNLWEWHYADRLRFSRRRIPARLSDLEHHMLLAYSGRPHPQSRNGSRMLDRFREKSALAVFASISEHARRFAHSLSRRDFRSAGASLSAEYHLRSSLLEVLDPSDHDLKELANGLRCGFTVTGHGGGGCVWAIGEKRDISELRTLWSESFMQRDSGFILPVRATRSGLKVTTGAVPDPPVAARVVEYE